MNAQYDPYCPDCEARFGKLHPAACGLSNAQHRRVRKAKKKAEREAVEVRTQELVAAEYPGARLTQLYTRVSGEVAQRG